MIRAATPAPAASASPTSMAIRPTGRLDELSAGLVTTTPGDGGPAGDGVDWTPSLLLLAEEPPPTEPGWEPELEPGIGTGTVETSADRLLVWPPATSATSK